MLLPKILITAIFYNHTCSFLYRIITKAGKKKSYHTSGLHVHWQCVSLCTVVPSGGSLEAPAFSSTGPCSCLFYALHVTGWPNAAITSVWRWSLTIPPGEHSPVAAGSWPSNGVTHLRIGNPLKSSGLLDPLLCGLALAPRLSPHELSRQIVVFYMVGRWASSTREVSWSRSRKPLLSGSNIPLGTD